MLFFLVKETKAYENLIMKNIILFLSFILFSLNALAFDHSHSNWTELLSQHVTMSPKRTSSKVDYKNFNKKKLKAYLQNLSSVSKDEFKTFSNDQKLAFFINSYNAYTIQLILDHYPVDSIKDIGSFFSSPWKKEFFILLGQKRSLDEIEHEMVRKSDALGADARIHFAFNCASIGCPALLNEAFTAQKINRQLDQASKNFLKDHSRNRVNLKKERVELSNIFKWYKGDFETKNYRNLKDFLSKYADSISKNEQEKKLIKSKKYSITFSGYDWNLNSL